MFLIWFIWEQSLFSFTASTENVMFVSLLLQFFGKKILVYYSKLMVESFSIVRTLNIGASILKIYSIYTAKTISVLGLVTLRCIRTKNLIMIKYL